MTAEAVAVELRRRLPGLGVKKQHKLLYYAQAHHLASFERPLFTETISAWDMGPVVGQLWHAEHNAHPATETRVSLGEDALNTIGYVVSRYGALSGGELERLTHSETPWQEANAARSRSGTTAKMTVESIRVYFTRMDNDAEDTGAYVDAEELSAWLKDTKPLEQLSQETSDDGDSLTRRLRSLRGRSVDH